MTAPSSRPRNSRRGAAIAVAAAAIGMLGLSYAAVPLYKLFCEKTGFAGTTQVAREAPKSLGRRKLVVRFDTNVGAGLPWRFVPETPSIDVVTGQVATVFFKVTNEASRATAARATYNVSPDVMGGYFDKLACFCFNEQRLGPGESMEMPVVFFLDPALEKDETMNAVDAATLSYTFYPSRVRPEPVADAKAGAPKL